MCGCSRLCSVAKKLEGNQYDETRTMRIGLMVEGQANLTWDRWLHILHTAERLGFPTVFGSDHYFLFGKQQNSLDAYLRFVIAARETETVRFGTCVSPIKFRSPVDMGRMAAQINQLANGRFVLGVGAGWHQPEHDAYGIAFPSTRERFDRLEEGINVIKTLWGPGPASYSGKYYALDNVDCLPKPVDGEHTPIMMGGAGEKRTLPLVVRYADEWNCVNLTAERYRDKLAVLERLCAAENRDLASIRKSMMAFGLCAGDIRSLDRLTRYQMAMAGATGSTSAYREQMQSNGFIVGLTQEVVDQLGELAQLGLEEVEFQWFNYAYDEVPEYLASDIAPRVS